MFISNKEYDELNARNVELARKIRELTKENKKLTEENLAVHEENKDLRFENEEQKDILKEINNLARTQQYGSVKNLQNKLKELARPLNQN